MNQNMSKIRAGLQAMAGATPQLVSGTVVPGSVNSTANTCDVLPFSGAHIRNVLLSAISEHENGFIGYPSDSSHVIIGSVNGAGQWVVLAASEFEKYMIKSGAVQLEVSANGIALESGSTQVRIGDLLKIATASENLNAILTDLVNAIASLTVGTPSGPSTVPVNIASFTALLPRISNLLSS